MVLQSDRDVADELMKSLIEDTEKVSKISMDSLYSLQTEGYDHLISKNSSFEAMGLKPELINGLYTMKYEKPSIIQSTAIPVIKEGKDCAFQSKSGTGKTIAFAIGAVDRSNLEEGSQVIILTPTRELCIQVGGVVAGIANILGIKVCYALGNFIGETITEEIIVGCPGKILGLVNSKAFDSSKIKMIVFDEADELISNQAFGAQSLRLLKVFEKAQKVFFSATYSDMSQRALSKLAPNCENYFEKNVKADKIQLYYVEVENKKKIEALKTIFTYLTMAQTIVFTNTKHLADIIKNELAKDDFSVSVLHSNMEPSERDMALGEFSQAKTKIMISTNVFSRGMDIPQVNLIINFDLPNYSADADIQTYIHRVGRSGRFNRSGYAIDFVSGEQELKHLTNIYSSINETGKRFTLEALSEAFNKNN